jgi:hypothetical protein
MSELPNPFDNARDYPIFKWSTFKVGVEYEVELICHKYSFTKPYGKDGGYTTYCAIATNDYQEPLMIKGDYFVFDISYREFQRAINEQHPIILRSMSQQENVVMKFVKTSLRAMKIISLVPKENNEFKEKAMEEYSHMRRK